MSQSECSNIVSFQKIKSEKIQLSLKSLALGSEHIEIESQYDLRRGEDLYRIAYLAEALKKEPEDGISCVSSGKISRPISVYFDTAKHYLLSDHGCTLRLRYGGNSFKPMVCCKVNVQKLGGSELLRAFGLVQSEITQRIEIETPIALADFSPRLEDFFPNKKLSPAEIYLRDRIGELLQDDPLDVAFITDSRRLRFLLSVPVSYNRSVCFELATDDCSYYHPMDGACIYVPESASSDRKQKVIVPHPDKIDFTNVRGTYMGYRPQFELEYVAAQSSKGILMSEIVAAEKSIISFFREHLGPDAFEPKESKGTVGVQLCREGRGGPVPSIYVLKP